MLAIRDLLRLGPETQETLINSLSDQNPHVRHVCVTVLGISATPDAGEALSKLLTNDPDPIVRGQAAQAIGQIDYKQGVPTLQKAVSQDQSEHVRHRAKLAIGRIKEGVKAAGESIDVWNSLDESTFRRVQVGQAAPDFELKDTNGKTWQLSDLKNKKTVVLIWIFADWCPVCNREFHELIEMEEQFKKADVQVFTIECHDLYRCKVMVGARNLWWPHLVDTAGKIGAQYGVDPMEFIVHDEWINRPSTIIIDTEGVVRFAYYGTYWGDRPTIEETLEMVRTNLYSFRHPKRRE